MGLPLIAVLNSHVVGLVRGGSLRLVAFHNCTMLLAAPTFPIGHSPKSGARTFITVLHLHLYAIKFTPSNENSLKTWRSLFGLRASTIKSSYITDHFRSTRNSGNDLKSIKTALSFRAYIGRFSWRLRLR